MLDLRFPESKKIIDACCLIEELSMTYRDIQSPAYEDKDSICSKSIIKLGKLGLLADELLNEKRKELANKNIKYLYKVFSGQIKPSGEDSEKVHRLLNELSDDCFNCWCI